MRRAEGDEGGRVRGEGSGVRRVGVKGVMKGVVG